MASAMKRPSAECEIKARGVCARFSGQQAGERPMRECQKHTTTPPPALPRVAHTASATASFSRVQRMVARHRRT